MQGGVRKEPSSSVQRSSVCECYKKLHAFGIPLYIAEEDELYSESQNVVPYENVFRLPGILEINEDVLDYPVVEGNELFSVFQQMAHVLPSLSDFEQNVLSFWILDVFAEGLWTAQNAKMSNAHQKATLLWIAYFFNYIQKENPSRRELFDHLKTVLFQCDKSEAVNGGECEIESKEIRGEEDTYGKSKRTWKLPLPPKLGESVSDDKSFSDKDGEEHEDNTLSGGSDAEKPTKTSLSSASGLKEEETDAETNVQHMNVILEILYRIFARSWVYLEIQTVFHAMPPVQQVDLPFTLKVPKPLFRPEPSIQMKVEKGGKRQSFSEKSYEETEIERQLRRNDYILPLQEAEESKLYLKQFSGQPSSDRSGLNRNRKN